ncbi:alpha/beta hydrolase family protein [Kangiella koreensis]|uniref:Alpha/beta hydrolase fold protein n=1 Tax=Kangiella koreensis (strain DSM 16069 / JCM 12317 / KCTC 12182 / SW-125) TaxID=523791 RepID=C7R5Q2_KANKD|nr:alpha/beta fold hydrolase [Kangiella koreensis]ACV27226.1 alpha/beta hydrolase fold protein [Kangiella koreensis DSM 16069]
MRRTYKVLMTIILLTMLGSKALLAKESIVGDWSGTLDIQGTPMSLVFHIKQENNNEYTATMDSPDQGASGIQVSKVDFNNNVVRLEVAIAQGFFEGKLSSDGKSIEGSWVQGHNFPLVLKKNQELKVPQRPQEPKKPYPYKSQEVSYPNTEAGITLAGTLTIPQGKGPFPAAILISGSGPQDRNQMIMGHKPFLVLADHLTRQGIAVLRFDDRGVGESTGDFSQATSLDFSTDVEAGLKFLQSQQFIDAKRIGLIGHSEGGLIAPIVAANNQDVAYSVLMAGPGISGMDISLAQARAILSASGLSEAGIDGAVSLNRAYIETLLDESATKEMIQGSFDLAWQELSPSVKEELKAMGGLQLTEQQFELLLSPWYRYFAFHKPQEWLRKVKSPVLAINGEKDFQVLADSNLTAIEQALKEGGNTRYAIVKFPGLNHLFQEADTGQMNEYARIEQTFSPVALNTISEWILKNVE